MSKLVVVDLEATCWPPGDERRKKQREISEIIEIYAVKVSIDGHDVLGDFHYYVKPLSNQILSDFCIDLTGIQQSQIDKAQGPSSMIKSWSEWMGDTPFTLASWGPMDQGLLSTTWTAHLNQALPWCHLDIQKLFEGVCKSHRAENTPWYQQSQLSRISGLSLKEGIRSIGVTFEGEAHSAKVDAFAALACLRFILTNQSLTPHERLLLEQVSWEDNGGEATYWGSVNNSCFLHKNIFMKTARGLMKRGLIRQDHKTGGLWRHKQWS